MRIRGMLAVVVVSLLASCTGPTPPSAPPARPSPTATPTLPPVRHGDALASADAPIAALGFILVA